MNNLIRLQQVKKIHTLGDHQLEAINIHELNINMGEYVAILGPSGSGKSTLMNILGCLDTPTKGQYFFNNKEVSQLNRNELATVRNKQIGFIFQSFNLLEYANALENVTLPLLYSKIDTASRDARARQLLAKVGLADRLLHRPNQLSGGQCQRVAIARALVNDPSLILADEPTGNLDSRSGEQVIQLFEECIQLGKTIIIVTHDITLAQRAHRVIKIRDGKIESDTLRL